MTPGVFIPDRDPVFYLLACHRQPLAYNVARAYIEEFTSPGDLIVDPFAASPVTARVALACGRRAVAVESNPLVAFAARVQATLPTPREIMVALARWGEVMKEGEPLRVHLEELYASRCAVCDRPVVVDYFVWVREPNAPAEKVYTCDKCGARHDAATEADRSRAAEIKPRGFHYHLLLERLAANESPQYNTLRQLLGLYTPRNLYALVTLTLKLDAEFEDEATRTLLAACLLHALDTGSTLYPEPDGLPERQTPEKFVERNIWRALETAAAGLSAQAPGVPLAASPAAVVNSTGPAIFIGHGSAHSLAEAFSPGAALVLSSPARLDPTFWQLSYLWTRWTLGKTASRSLEPFLDETRQRWGWYGTALAASLRDSAQLLKRDGRLVAAFPAGSHAMIEALCLAASPEFRLGSLAFRPHRGAVAASEFGALRGDYRVTWSLRSADPAQKSAQEVAADIQTGALRGATRILGARAEPLAYSWIHHQALEQLDQEGTSSLALKARVPVRDNAFQFFRRELEAGLKEGYASDIDHWKEGGRVLWLQRQPPRGTLPLADRVEEAVREILEEARAISNEDLEDRVLARFPGLLTPERELVDACAAAYADCQDGFWHWRKIDVIRELERARELAGELGKRLGFEAAGGGERFEMVWRDERIVPASSGGHVEQVSVWEESHLLLFRERAEWPELLRRPAAPLRGFVVIPEAQVELTKERLRRFPPLIKRLQAAGWEFLRVPFVEMLRESQTASRAELQLALGLEPALAKGKEQMELF